jgi:chaperone required for assembly of F1-ATPase
MSEWAAKRFWTDTNVVQVGEGFAIHLDARPVRTPAKAPLILPSQAMADAVAAEWEAQGDKIDPLTMPYTRSANAAIDKVTSQKAEVVEMIAAYGDSDLICYRADSPQGLVARQAAGWDPLVDYAATELGAPLVLVTGVMHLPQDPESLQSLTDHVAALDPFQLTAFHDLVSLSGSLIMGFAAIRGYASPTDLWDLSRIDEQWQIEQWGEDELAMEQAGLKRAAFLHAAQFYASCS